MAFGHIKTYEWTKFSSLEQQTTLFNKIHEIEIFKYKNLHNWKLDFRIEIDAWNKSKNTLKILGIQLK